MSKLVKVRLLVARTNYGAIGDVVEYDEELAADHVARGLVEYADQDKSAAAAIPDKPKKAGKKRGGKGARKQSPRIEHDSPDAGQSTDTGETETEN